MKRRTRAALSALFALSVLGLGACGTEPVAEQQAPATAQAGAAQQPAAPPPDPAAKPPSESAPDDASKGSRKDGSRARTIDTARLAYKKTTEAQSAKVTMLMEVSGLSREGDGPDGFVMRMDGIVDFERDVSVFTMNMPGFGPIKMRQVGMDIYERFPEPVRSEMPNGKPWLRINLEDFMGGSYDAAELKDGAPTSLEAQLEYLRGVSQTVDKLGTAPVRGVPTTHYRAKIDLGEAAAGESRQTRRAFKALRDQVGEERIWVEMWVDDGLMRRSVMDVPLANLGAASGSGGARMQIAQEMYDFGAPVTVEPPPADQTTEI